MESEQQDEERDKNSSMISPPIASFHASAGSTTSTQPPRLPSPPILRSKKSASTLFHVIRKRKNDEETLDENIEIGLEHVFDCEEWRELVPPNTYVMVRMSMQNFLVKKEGKRNAALSYRWENKIVVKTGGRAPNGVRLPIQVRELAIDFMRALELYADAFSFVWVDFLCHLDVDVHREVILNTMGELYTRALVLPLYLVDFARACEDNEKIKMRDENKDEKKETKKEIKGQKRGTDKGSSRILCTDTLARKRLLTALRRAWIQQEIGYGELFRGAVERFVHACLQHHCWDELATFLRRRPFAIRWMVENMKDVTMRDVTTCEGDMNDKNTFSKASVTMEHDKCKSMLGFAKIPSPPKSNKLARPNPSALHRACSRLKAMSPTFVIRLIENICFQQRFDASDLFSSVRLLRAFSESAVFREDDIFVSTLQCAAKCANLEWIPGSSPLALRSQTAILRKCWRTMLESKMTFTFRNGRIDPQAVMLGIFLEPPAALANVLSAKKGILGEGAFVVHVRDRSRYVMFSIKEQRIVSINVITCNRHTDHADMRVDSIDELFGMRAPNAVAGSVEGGTDNDG